MTPQISVVIPVYNRSWELRRALESLARQTIRNFEVIVCDDGSTEDIRAVLGSFQGRMEVRYERIENSGGPARPRNVAIRAARGEWIAFLDSDDWWDDKRMSVVSAELGDDVDILYHSLRVVTAPDLIRTVDRRKVVGEPLRGDGLRHLAIFGNPIPNSAAVVRRRMLLQIGGICEDRSIVEDFDTWLCLLESGARIRYLEQILGSYWVGEDGISAFSRRQIEMQIALYKRHLPRFAPALRFEAENRHNYMVGSMFFKLGGNRDLAKMHLSQACGLPTFSLRVKRFLKLAVILIRNSQ